MKKKRATKPAVKRAAKAASMRTPTAKELERLRLEDPTLYEFHTKDLGDDIRASGVGITIDPQRSLPTSILLELDLIQKLKEKAAKRGLGYQTMLKMIAREHIDEY